MHHRNISIQDLSEQLDPSSYGWRSVYVFPCYKKKETMLKCTYMRFCFLDSFNLHGPLSTFKTAFFRRSFHHFVFTTAAKTLKTFTYSKYLLFKLELMAVIGAINIRYTPHTYTQNRRKHA